MATPSNPMRSSCISRMAEAPPARPPFPHISPRPEFLRLRISAGRCVEAETKILSLAVPDDGQHDLVPGLVLLEHQTDVGAVPDAFSVNGDEDVSKQQPAVAVTTGFPDAGPVGRASGADTEDDRTLEAESPADAVRRELESQTGPLACVGPRGADDGGIDADQAARGIQERTAGIAGIDRRVRLDDIPDRDPGDRIDFTSKRRDDAGCQGLVREVPMRIGCSFSRGASILSTARSFSGA